MAVLTHDRRDATMLAMAALEESRWWQERVLPLVNGFIAGEKALADMESWVNEHNDMECLCMWLVFSRDPNNMKSKLIERVHPFFVNRILRFFAEGGKPAVPHLTLVSTKEDG